MLDPEAQSDGQVLSMPSYSARRFANHWRLAAGIKGQVALVNAISPTLIATSAYAQAAQNHLAAGLGSDYEQAISTLNKAVTRSMQPCTAMVLSPGTARQVRQIDRP